ncbi:MAG TPA: serine hydrolase domain-containing protein [Streptosporangiaceae bacterium]
MTGPQAGQPRDTASPPAGAAHAQRAGECAGEVLAAAVRDGVTPGAVFAAGDADDASVVVAGDAQVSGGPRRPMHRDTLFDLASLTKVVGTLPVILQLAELGELALEDRVSVILPRFRGEGREVVTVRQLLAHTGGLPAEIKFWQLYPDVEEATEALFTAPLEAPPGRRVIYSDLGFMLLGRVAEAVTGRPLDACVAELVTEPLGMARTGFRPEGEAAWEAAATELQPDGTAIVGVVHDENAQFFGGVSGHAGLFAPAADLACYLNGAWLSGQLLSAATRAEATRLQTEGSGGRRGLGWVLRGDQQDALGRYWPDSSITHTGFTGTSLACDPASGAWAVLLTNDVHFGRGRGVIRGVRESVHDCCAPGR